MKLARFFRQIASLTRWAFASTLGAFAITNELFANRTASWIPSCHRELADQAASVAAFNTGIAGLRWIRAKVYVKTFTTLTTGDVFTVTIQVGTGTAVTSPVNVAQANVTVVSGDTALVIELIGSTAVNTGYQSYEIVIATSSSHSFVADIMIDCA